MSQFRKIKVVGAGGIGSYLIEPLSRYLSYCKDSCEITVIDGDLYEDKNLQRQKFSLSQKGESKSKATVNQYKDEFEKIHFKHKSEYLTEDNIISLIREDDVIFLCVDNHATRKLVSDRCDQLKNVALISGGNDYTDGHVICYIRKDGKNLTKSLTELDSKIANPEDKNPAEVNEAREGCQQIVESQPQLLFMNLAIASMMLNCYRKFELDEIKFHQVYVDINTMRSRPSPEQQIELG